MDTSQPSSPTGKTLRELWDFGKVFRIQSEKFGTHDVLCVKSPGTCAEERYRGLPVKPNGETSELLHYSSVNRDLVLKSWPNLRSYYADALAQASAPTKSISITPV